jgi:hypothetical protein
MSDEEIDDIDYENLNDLPLMDHIEWSHVISEEFAADELNQADWLV